MRKLQTKDVFEVLRIIKKANIKEELKPYVKMAANSELDIEELGIDGVLGLIEILSQKNSEKALYDALAGPFEMTAKEVENLDLNKLIENLETLAKENDLKVFMCSVSGMISKQ